MNPAGTGTHTYGGEPARQRTAAFLSAAMLLGGLGLALSSGTPIAVVLAVVATGVVGTVAVLARPALRALRAHRLLIVAIALVGLVGAWIDSGLRQAGHVSTSILGRGAHGVPNPALPVPYRILAPATSWPWHVGRTNLLPLMVLILSAAAGVVLLADAVRVQSGFEPTQWTPWRLISSPPARRTRVAWRAVSGVVLIAGAALLAITLADAYVAGSPLLQTLVLVGVSAGAMALVASPLIVGSVMRIDRDKAGRARETERQRFAAHLHDSVLQTLALVQRQAHDPAAVVRLARRQEHALRAWMAGEAELASETLVAGLREVVAEVEDDYGITAELTTIGDRPLDRGGEALVAAAREALRNAGRHAGGAPVYVFGEITSSRAELFIRDEGPGFDPDAVPAERRGLRDAVVGRMASVGGRAVIESTQGEGTEIALLLAMGGGER